MEFIDLSKLKPGDKVAILSPSSDAASYFPWVLDRAIDRLKGSFNLIPVEYPSTRKKKPSPKERAEDLMRAFSDKEIKAIFTTIGGSDQVRILPYLDKEVIKNNPKLFMGYSDNTNLSQFLWNIGIPSYYGGALMVQFAMQGSKILQQTEESLRWALFDGGVHAIKRSDEFTDIELEWSDKSNLDKTRSFEKNDGWYWDGTGTVSGKLWGGCIESLLQYLSAGNEVLIPEGKNIVLFLETAENIPEPWVIETIFNSLGVLGILERTVAVLVGRPKAWEFNKRLSSRARIAYREKQRNTIIGLVREYNSSIPIIQNMDFGHTDPQIIVPFGNKAMIDSASKTIKFTY
ncbi:LD-carboxypeptidase [Candidatus Saccharibacteria bacterium]|nr:MAG: LD-carboxypeptidase [Candidatus Saccharibacteria bacterium]